jgi:uncharacterized membrane protein
VYGWARRGYHHWDMLAWLKGRWQDVVRGLWFFPGLTAASAAVLALVLVQVDRRAVPDGAPFLFDGDASAARTILATVGTTLITVAGLAFSITVVTAQLVSSQFSPRALRSFLADRPSQLYAGAFVGIFAYCLLVLRTVRDAEDGSGEFVPSLAVSVAIALGLLGLGLLLAFIHRVTQIIKVENIAARLSEETVEAIERLYPRAYAPPEAVGSVGLLAAWEASGEPLVVRAARPCYVRAVAVEEFARTLPEPTRVHVTVRPGDQVTTSTPVLRVWWEGELGREVEGRLQAVVTIRPERDVAGDAGFGVSQLADAALRALSPGVNDPTTAVTCVGYIRQGLELLARRALPDPVRRLEGAEIVIAAPPTPFQALAEPLAEVGRSAARDVRVAVVVLDALAGIAAAAAQAGAAARAAWALEIGDDLAARALRASPSERDRRLLDDASARLRIEAAYPTRQGPDDTGRSSSAAASSTSSTGTA